MELRRNNTRTLEQERSGIPLICHMNCFSTHTYHSNKIKSQIFTKLNYIVLFLLITCNILSSDLVIEDKKMIISFAKLSDPLKITKNRGSIGNIPTLKDNDIYIWNMFIMKGKTTVHKDSVFKNYVSRQSISTTLLIGRNNSINALIKLNDLQDLINKKEIVIISTGNSRKDILVKIEQNIGPKKNCGLYVLTSIIFPDIFVTMDEKKINETMEVDGNPLEICKSHYNINIKGVIESKGWETDGKWECLIGSNGNFTNFRSMNNIDSDDISEMEGMIKRSTMINDVVFGGIVFVLSSVLLLVCVYFLFRNHLL